MPPWSYTAITLAIRDVRVDLLKLLLIDDCVDVNESEYDVPALHFDAINGHFFECFKRVMESERTEMTKKCERGYTALHYAAMYDRTDIVRLILEDGRVDPATLSNRGYSAIMIHRRKNVITPRGIQRLKKCAINAAQG
jgi:ankyrin repeat protein